MLVRIANREDPGQTSSSVLFDLTFLQAAI